MRIHPVLVLAFLCLFALPLHAAEKEPIKIGDLFAYTSFPAEGGSYKKGWQRAVEEINAEGGILGRPVKVISRDTGDTPQQGILVAQELIDRDRVDVLAGTILGTITNAIANTTGQARFPLVTLWNTMPVQNGKQNDFMFSVMTTEGQAGAAADFASTLPAKKWATIAPNYAYGRLSVEIFKKRLKDLRPDVEFVDSRWPTVSKIDAAGEVLSLRHSEPEAIYSTLFASDLAAFVRAGNRVSFFDNKTVLGQESGEKIYTRVIGKELRGTWYGTGDPSAHPKDPAATFYTDYRKEFGAEPDMYTYAGYLVYRFIFAAIQKAGSTEPEKLVQALAQVSISTPMGSIRMDPATNRSNFGVWIGRLQPTAEGADLVDWVYKDAAPYLVPEKK